MLKMELQKANAQNASLQQTAEHDVSRLSGELQHEAKMRAETDERNKLWESRVEELECAVQVLSDRSSALQQAATDAQKKLSDELEVQTSPFKLPSKNDSFEKTSRRKRNCGSARSRTASYGCTRSTSSRSGVARIPSRGRRSPSTRRQRWSLKRPREHISHGNILVMATY